MYQPNSIKTLLKLKTQYNNSGEKWTNIDVEEQKENKNTQPKQIQQHKRANSSKPGKRETPLKKIQSSKLEERANSQEKKKQSQQILPYEDDVLNPRNFHNNLYQDDNFMYMKEQMAYSMINLEVNITKERKELMYDVDYQLQDLQDWKKKQKNKQEWFKEEEEKIQQQYEREIERKHINKYDDLDLEQKIYEDYINRHSSQIDFIDHWKQKKENNIKSLHNKQVHSQINEKLNNKEEEIQRIERYLKESKKGDSSQINKNKINSSIMENQEMNWAKQEQMYNQFVEFENQVNQFDEEINGLLFGKQTQKQDVTDDEINDLLKKIKEKEALQKNFKSNQPGVPDDGGESDKINSILNDIENEFKELDDLLKEVDELQKGEEMVAPGEKGFRVFCVPEAATLLMKGGAMGNTYKFNFTQAVRFQMGIMESQMALENVFTDFAKNENVPSVILCDRGLLDGSAYVDKDVWQAVLDESGWSTAQLRDKRYDSIIHLVTAAEGAEQFYSYGNKTRYEDIQQAIDVDKRLRNAYLGHHKFFIVDNNYVDFRAKVDRCVHLSLKSIGLPIPNEHFKKYLVQIQDPENHDTLFIPKNIQVERINIQEALLQVPDSYDNKENLEIYIRKRGSHGQFTYNHEIRYVQNNERIQKKSILSAREYVELLATLKPQTKIIEKVRSCFVYENQTFIVDTLLNVDGKPTFLRIEEGDQQIKLPPFLSIVKDVTNQEEFSTKELALHNFKMPNLDKGQKDRVK